MTSELMTIKDVCDLLRISRRQFDNIRHRLPPPIVLGPRTLRWRREVLDEWLIGATRDKNHGRPT